MAETSGFFEAKVNEETNEYDRVYYASQFAQYFALFIGNGVFAATSDQLLVESVSGMRIKVNPGWGFIEGYWYNNDEDLIIDVPVNTMAVSRTDIVVLRRDEALRDTHIVYLEGESEIRRDGSYFDLLLAIINIPVGSASISNANITDKRPDEEVCGFVKGLVDVITTDALFNQFTAQFNEWFVKIQSQLTDDVVTKLTSDIGTLSKLKTTNKTSLVSAINELNDEAVAQVLTFKNVSVPISAWESGGHPDYPFYADIACQGVTEEYVPNVVFGVEDAASGNFCPVSMTYSKVVRIFIKEAPTSVIKIETIQCIKSF